MRNGRNADYIGLSGLLVFTIDAHQRIGDLVLLVVEALERRHQSHVLGDGLKRGIGSDQPAQELFSGLLILFGDLGVHAPVIADHLIQTLVLFALGANVDGEHSQIVVRHGLTLDLVVGPHAILEEHGLACGEFGD